MRHLITYPLFFLLICSASLFSQGNWTPKTAFPPGPRERAFHFTIGDKMYVGGGRNFQGGDFGGAINERDVWSYHFETDTWEELSPFPGTPFRNAVSFVIDGIAYIATGHDGSDYIDPFWKYDPSTDSWEELAPFPGGPMSFPVAFALGDKGYVTLGGIGADQPDRTFYNKILWEYDPETNEWSEKSEFPGEGRWRGFAFVINGMAYVGGGDRENRVNYNFSGLDFTDCYRYDPVQDQWSAIADFPEGYGVGCYALSIDGKGYVGEGAQHQLFADYRTKVWEYDPLTDVWAHVSNTPGPQFGRMKSFSGTYNGKAYIGGGRNYTTFSHMFGDFYEWDIEGTPAVPDYEFWNSMGRGNTDSAQLAVHALQAIDEDTIWALPAAIPSVSGAPLEIMFTHDGGTSWQTSMIDTTDRFIAANVFAFNGQRAWVAGSLESGETLLYQTADGGQSWTQKWSGNENTIGIAIGLHFFDGQTGICWGNDVSLFQGGSITVYRTTDGGDNWQKVEDANLPPPQTGQSGFNFSGNSDYDAVGDTIWIPALSGVFRSTDQGASWTATPPGTFPAWPFSLAFENGRRGMLVCDNLPGAPINARAFITQDGGETWVEIDLPEPPVGTALKYIPGTEGAYLAFGARFPGPRISYTPNFGADWYMFEAPPVISTVQFLSENVGYAGGPLLKNTAEGVYRWDGNFAEIINRDRLYVDAGTTGANDGSSWADAFVHLQSALNAAQEGDNIWIAGGTYFTDTARVSASESFIIDKNLRIYGGFAGTEVNLSERILGDHLTLLTGDLNQDDPPNDLTANRTDNALHVVKIGPTITNATVLDGLAISGGAARGSGGGAGDPDIIGGGMYVRGAPVIRHCTLENNYAANDGAGVYIRKDEQIGDRPLFEGCSFLNNFAEEDGGGLATEDPVEVTACFFEENRATVRGGGIYYRSLHTGNSAFRDNEFSANTATEAGGVYIRGESAASTYSFSGNSYVGNSAELLLAGSQCVGGGAYIILDEGYPENQLQIESDTFRQNSSCLQAGGLEVVLGGQNAELQITNSVFTGNSADLFGGAARISVENTAPNSEIYLSNCQVENNEALRGAGIEFVNVGDFSAVELSDSEFTGNISLSTQSNGGGMNIVFLGDDQSISIKRSDFVGNAGGFLGGGMSMGAGGGISRFSFLVDSCTFAQNTSTVAGGGIALDLFGLVEEADCKILNSVFQNNTAALFGGGIAMASYVPMVPDEVVEIRNCRFIENQAGQIGGGLGCNLDDNLQLSVTDCTFEGNEAAARGGGMYLSGTAPSAFDVNLSHSLFEGNQGVIGAAVAVDNLFSIGGNTGIPENARFRIENTLMADNLGDNGTISCRALENFSLINNTVANNMAHGIRLDTESGIHLQNNILYNPGFTDFLDQSAAAPVTSLGGNLLGDNSLTAFLAGSDLLTTNPLFLANDSYQLMEGSPAVDAGVLPDSIAEFDLAGNPRVQGNGIDIGAFESSFIVSAKEKEAGNSFLTIAPNPVREEMTVQINNGWRGPLRLKVYDALGKEVLHYRFRKSTPGWKEQLDVSRLPAGTYYLFLSNGKQFTQQPFVVD